MKRVLLPLLAVSISVGSCIYSTVAAAPAPAVHLSFEGDLKNQAGSDYSGKMTGNVKFEDKGAVGKGVLIDNGFIELENSKNIKFDKQMSFTMWIRVLNEEAFNPGLLLKPDKDGETYSSPFYVTTGLGYTALGADFSLNYPDEDNAYKWSSGSDYIFDSGMLMDKWHHIGVVFDGKMCTYYVDGIFKDMEEIASDYADFTKIADSAKNIYLGKGEQNFRGYMDEFKLFNTAITADDVAAIHMEGRKVLNSKMVLKLDNPNMIVNGVEKEIDPGRGTAPQLDADSDRTLVPIRALVEEMGGSITWTENDQRGRIDINLGSTNVKIWLYNQNAQVNGKPYTLDVVPRTINERTMLPLRFVTENLGAEVDWNQDTQEITVRYAK